MIQIHKKGNRNWKRKLSMFMVCLLAASLLLNSIHLFAAEEENIALNKTAVFTKADGTQVDGAWGNNASNAVDGNPGTVAQPAYRGPLDFTVDLGKDYDVSEVTIAWDMDCYSDNYRILVSSDGASFTEIQYLKEQSGGQKAIRFSEEVQCRFLRIAMESIVGGGEYGAEGFGVGIWEFSAKGRSAYGEQNLALHKRVKMLDDDGNEIPSAWGNVPENAVDGAADTVAQASSNNWNLFVDLGAVASVSSFEIHNFWAAFIQGCEIKTSLDGVEWQTAASGICPPENQNSVITLPERISCRYVLLDVNSYAGAEGCIADFAVNGKVIKEEENVSLNKGAFMTENGAEVGFWGAPGNAVDGDNTTYAQSNSDVPWDLTIDLQSMYDITALDLNLNPSVYAKKYEIQISNDNENWTTIAMEENGSGASILYDFDRIYRTRYVKIDVKETVGGGPDWGHAINEVTVMGNEAPSLSRGKTVRAVSIEDGGMDIPFWGSLEGAVDDDIETVLQSQKNIPWDMIVDLGDFYNIYMLRYIADAESYAIDFDIEMSNNGYSFVPIKQIRDNQEYWNVYTFSQPITARYLRLNVKRNFGGGEDWGHAIREWNVFGEKAVEIPPDEISDITLDPESVSLLPGESVRINGTLIPGDTAAELIWSSDNTQVATVDRYGKITGQGAGTTRVWAKASDVARSVEVSVAGNIALNKPVVMSIPHSWENVAQNAVDGDRNTVAQGSQNVKWELLVDLEGFYNIRALHLAMDIENYASQYKILGSTNGIGWKEILTEENYDPSDMNRYTFEAQFVRYVKLVPLSLVGGGDLFGYAVQELEVYGTKASGQGNTMVDKIQLGETELALRPGESRTVAVNIAPLDSVATVFWKSSDESIAKVDGAGNIMAISGGLCDVTVTAGDKEAVLRVFVKENLAKGKKAFMSTGAVFGNMADFAVDGDGNTVAQGMPGEPWDLIVDLGYDYEIDYIKVCPDYECYARNFDLLVSRDGKKYTKVASETDMAGAAKAYAFEVVTARYIKMDVHEAYVAAADCGHAIREFEVYGPLVRVENAALEETSIKLGIKEAYQIPLKVLPENATIRRAAYRSSDESIAVVNENGVIKGVSEGKAVITVTTYDGAIQDQMEVEVFREYNIAYGKQAIMSVPAGFDKVAAYAVDGDPTTYAQACRNEKWTLTVDLGTEVLIGRVNVMQDAFNFASKCIIKVSKDGVKWETAGKSDKVIPAGTSVRFAPVEARYVMFEPLEIVGGGADFGYAIREFEVFQAYGVDLDQLRPAEIVTSGPGFYDGTELEQETQAAEAGNYLDSKLMATGSEVNGLAVTELNIVFVVLAGILTIANVGLLVLYRIKKVRERSKL